MSDKRSNSATKRTRNFVTVVYPESAPDSWRVILSEQFIQCFISPLHDKDVNPDGTSKKPHYHVLLMFDSVKTIEQAKEVFALIGGVGCEVVKSLRAYSRYLCHLDNPDKAQYDISDVECLCGADYISIIGLAIDKLKAIDEMMDFCDEYNVVSFYALSKYARLHRSDWSRVLKESGTLYMREYLKSRQWSIDNDKCHILDPVTGEVII